MEPRVTTWLGLRFAGLAVESATRRTARCGADTVATIVDQTIRALGWLLADASVSLKTSTLRADRRVRENTASAIVDSSNGTATAVTRSILERHNLAQIDGPSWTSAWDVKLGRQARAIAEHRRQSSLLSHKTSIERNILCCAGQRKAGEHDDGLPGFMHGWERKEKGEGGWGDKE